MVSPLFKNTRALRKIATMLGYKRMMGNFNRRQTNETSHYLGSDWSVTASASLGSNPQQRYNHRSRHDWARFHGSTSHFSRYGVLQQQPDWDYVDGTPAPESRSMELEHHRRVEINRQILLSVLKAELMAVTDELPALPHTVARDSGPIQFVGPDGKVRDRSGHIIEDYAANTLNVSTKRTGRYSTRRSKVFTGVLQRPATYASFPPDHRVPDPNGGGLVTPVERIKEVIADQYGSNWGQEFMLGALNAGGENKPVANKSGWSVWGSFK